MIAFASVLMAGPFYETLDCCLTACVVVQKPQICPGCRLTGNGPNERRWHFARLPAQGIVRVYHPHIQQNFVAWARAKFCRALQGMQCQPGGLHPVARKLEGDGKIPLEHFKATYAWAADSLRRHGINKMHRRHAEVAVVEEALWDIGFDSLSRTSSPYERTRSTFSASSSCPMLFAAVTQWPPIQQQCQPPALDCCLHVAPPPFVGNPGDG